MLQTFTKQMITDGLLDKPSMEMAISALLDPQTVQEHIIEFLTALHHKGESAQDLSIAAHALKSRLNMPAIDDGLSDDILSHLLDCCGTGGDGSHSLNISTATSFVLAACGVPVAKHGNRAATSKSGAADVLEALDVNLNTHFETNLKTLRDHNIAFFMAPNYHHSLKHLAPIRRKINHRTIFNLLGPLSNPLPIKRQLMGVFSKDWVAPMAQALKELGHVNAITIFGHDGIDEASIFDKSSYAHLKDDEISHHILNPKSFGVYHDNISDLAGGDPAFNAAAIIDLFKTQSNSGYFKSVLLNSALGLIISGTTASIEDGLSQAEDTLKSGKVHDLLMTYREATQHDQ